MKKVTNMKKLGPAASIKKNVPITADKFRAKASEAVEIDRTDEDKVVIPKTAEELAFEKAMQDELGNTEEVVETEIKETPKMRERRLKREADAKKRKEIAAKNK
jgi:hypothetical protein